MAKRRHCSICGKYTEFAIGIVKEKGRYIKITRCLECDYTTTSPYQARRFCPACQKVQRFIYFGRFSLSDGTSSHRLRCTRCGKTLSSPARHPFFERMHRTPDKIMNALEMYSHGATIQKIVSSFEKNKPTPNTVLSWIKRVRDNRNKFKSYLKVWLNYSEDDVKAFFNGFHKRAKRKRQLRLIRMNKTRTKKSSLPSQKAAC